MLKLLLQIIGLFLDNSVSFDSSFGRFVQVRPLQLSVQNRDSVSSDHHDDAGVSSTAGYSLHPYSLPINNGWYLICYVYTYLFHFYNRSHLKIAN